jgi:hypothetical protein
MAQGIRNRPPAVKALVVEATASRTSQRLSADFAAQPSTPVPTAGMNFNVHPTPSVRGCRDVPLPMLRFVLEVVAGIWIISGVMMGVWAAYELRRPRLDRTEVALAPAEERLEVAAAAAHTDETSGARDDAQSAPSTERSSLPVPDAAT